MSRQVGPNGRYVPPPYPVMKARRAERARAWWDENVGNPQPIERRAVARRKRARPQRT